MDTDPYHDENSSPSDWPAAFRVVRKSLARHPNRVLRHRALLGAVWGEASEEQPEYLRVFMGQLRKKLELDPSNPRFLVTEPWVGYRFNPNG